MFPHNSIQIFDSSVTNVLLGSFDCILSGGAGFDCPITDVVNTMTWLRWILHFNDILPSQLLGILWKDTLRRCNYPAPYHTSNVFIYSYQDKLIVSCFIQWDKVLYSHYLDIPVVPDLAMWEPLQAACCVLVICAHHSVSTSLLFGTTRYSRLILYFPSVKSVISHFFPRNLEPC